MGKDENAQCNCFSCIVKNLIFEHMSTKFQEEMCSSKKELLFKKGDVIVSQGQPVDEFIYLKSGLVKLHQQKPFHHDVIIFIAKPFDFITLLTIFSETHYQYSITALEDTEVCKFSYDKLREMILSNANFAFAIIQRMSCVTNKIITSTTELNRKNLRGRIAQILLFFSEEIYQNPNFTLPITRKEIGELIGMTTENVIRIISEFNKDGLIHLDGKHIEILESNRLKAIAEKG